MENPIEIYKTENGAEINVKLENQTIWLDTVNIAKLFNVNRSAIVKHIQNTYKSGELEQNSTCSIMEQVAADGKKRKINRYNLDVIISVGYRVNSKQATQFRQWATQRLKDYLVNGYAVNEKRLDELQIEVHFFKSGIQILNRVIESHSSNNAETNLLRFTQGLAILDDYDHRKLSAIGKTIKPAYLPSKDEYLAIIKNMKSEFYSAVFAAPKDDSFESSIAQIAVSFDGQELYPSIEEKAATLLYLIVKNHSFVDGNKRIGAACFLYFLEKNQLLFDEHNNPILSNEALAALTLFVAVSKTEEMEIIKNLIISILNKN